MAELVKGSTELSDQAAAVYAANLLRHYSFELENHTVDQLLVYWLETYSINWVRLAMVEALYQGRYKAISVEQILALWLRRGEPIYHFNHEFERLVCDKFPRNLLIAEDEPLSSPLDPGLLYRRVPFQPELQEPSPLPQPLEDPQPGLSSDAGEHFPAVQSVQPKPVSKSVQVSLPQFGSSDRPPPPSSIPQPEPTESPDVIPPSQSVQSSNGETIGESNQISLEDSSLEESPATNGAIAFPFEPPEQAEQPNVANSAATAIQTEQLTASPPPTPIADTIGETQQGIEPASKPDCLTETDFLLPCPGLSDQAIKPKLKLELAALYQPNWSVSSTKPPIHQFIPISETSDFHSKLKSVAKPHSS